MTPPAAGLHKRLERWGRYTLARLVDRLLGQRHRDPAAGPPPRSILIVRFDRRVGNLLLLTPLLAALARDLPGCAVDLVVHADVRRVLARFPGLRHVYPFRKWALASRQGWPWLLWRLRRERYDVVLDASHPSVLSMSHALFAWAAQRRGRHLIGAWRSALIGVYATAPPEPDDPAGSGTAAVALPCADRTAPLGHLYSWPVAIPASLQAERLQYLELVRCLGVRADTPPPLAFSPQRQPAAGDGSACGALLAELAAQARRYAVLNLGAGSRERVLPPALYAELIDLLAAGELRSVLTWGPGERELAEAVAALRPALALQAPPTDLDELFGLMAGAAAVLTGDTGPMHLAVASGTPTLALFTVSDPERFGHDYGPHRVLRLPPGAAALDAVRPAISAWLRATVSRYQPK